jgi:hypothetical protein
MKKRCKQQDDNDCTQDEPSAAAPLPRFDKRVPMLFVEIWPAPTF